MRLPGWILVFTLSGLTAEAGEPVLELTVGDAKYVGRAVAHDNNICWLAHADGSLSQVSLHNVSAYRQVEESFQSLTSLEARNSLREEFGREWEIVGTGHYLVAARNGRARGHAEQFEKLYRSFRSYFSRRGFRLPEPDFPLVAVVFANQREFVDQCRADDVPFIAGLKGYYHRKSNRIALFERGDQFVRQSPASNRVWATPFTLAETRGNELGFVTPSDARYGRQNLFDGNIQGSLKDTIVHEATHQVAYNLGLHSRVGQPPLWMVEGLATMFEAEGTRQNTGGRHARERVNEERFWWFGLYRQERRQPGSLADFIATENAIKRSPLDFYAEAWALTFFLAETRPRDYAAFLKTVAQRDPLSEYSGGQRIADFQTAFGDDIPRLEVEMLRFFDNLK